MTERVLDIIRDHTKRAPVNIEALGRALGLRVQKNAFLPDGISGHLRRADDGVYEIASSGREHYFRQRFTLAHEIGHFVLHKSVVDLRGGVDDDEKYRSTERGDIYNSHIDLFHEKQANSFAANVLMPEEAVRSAIGERQSVPLSELYKKFQVSPSAMRWRLRSLELIDHVQDDAA